jgi:hypothetical protein
VASSDFSPGFPLDFTTLAYTFSYGCCGQPTQRDLACSIAYFRHIPLSLRRRVLHGCIFRLFTASLAFGVVEYLGSLFFPYGLSFRRCKIHVMLRAVTLLPFLKELQRFSTASHPAALVACYVAA